MRPDELKQNLGKPVLYTNPTLYMENSEYILTAAILRRGEQGFFYQAELTDPVVKRSVVICRLEDIERMEVHHDDRHDDRKAEIIPR